VVLRSLGRSNAGEWQRAGVLPQTQGTFTVCSFWLVSVLALIGQTARARAICQKLLSFGGSCCSTRRRSTPREHLGNFPHASTHLALVEAVSLLIASAPEDDTEYGG
jgi:alpha,alpha-trehalase